MSGKSREYIRKDIEQGIKKGLEAVAKLAREEPDVILEIDTTAPENSETIKEIGSWLFRRRQEDDSSSGNAR